MIRLFLISILFSLMFISCASVPEISQIIKEPTTVNVADEELPKTVAVIPFENKTEEVGIANQVRKTFYNHFSSKPYSDIELNIVDEKIVQLERKTGKNILDLPPKDICEALGCDGLIYGRVTDYKKVYAGVYSQLGVEAEIWLINTKTGKEVFRIKDSVRYHEGGVPLSPLSAIMTAVSTALNLREIQQIRMVNELCHKFNERIPSPSGIIEQRPVIKEVLTNAKESPFGKGKTIQVGAEGDKGMVATFDIGNFKKAIPMKEKQPGIYIGEYVVMPGDNINEAPIIVSLKKPLGYETQWIDVTGFVTIDTTPPPQVKGLKAKGFYDRIEVSWEGLSNVPDLKGYKVLRSEKPLSDFKEVGVVEHSFFEDKNVEQGKIYYYRVCAFDAAGNISEIQDAVKGVLPTKEPQVLSGILEKDTTLSGAYIVKNRLKIPKGITLKIEPETRMLFTENALLIVEGKIIINGKDNTIEFVSYEGKKWEGILIENANVNIIGFKVKNAKKGLSINSTEGLIENGTIIDCDTALSVSGVPSPLIKNLTISGNKIGIDLTKTNTALSLCNIFQNETGIKLFGFSGEIKDSNIYDNSVNIVSETTLKIGANYFGSTNTDEMRLKSIELTRVYDSKAPHGKIVEPITNPYAKLSQEERQKKATELVIEAGNYFRQRNFGKAVTIFEEALKAQPSPEIYYFIAFCYQEMKEDEKALKYLTEGIEKYQKEPSLKRSLGLFYYQKGNEQEAKKVFEEVLKLNPEDRQVKFIMERLAGK